MSDSTSSRPPGQRRTPERRTIDLARAVNLALAGATYRQIATEIEADEETVRQHLMSPEGQRALRYAVNDLQARTDRFLASAHLQALRRLVREMEEAGKPSDRIRAAHAIVSLATRRIELTGADGGPIEVDGSVTAMLDERIARMRERSRHLIDVINVPEAVPSVPEIAAALETAGERSRNAQETPEPPAALDTADSTERPGENVEEPSPRISVADRRRAGPRLPPGGRLRAIP